MKTIADLNAIIPSLVDLINELFIESYESGEAIYDVDGWDIHISFHIDCEWGYEPGDYWHPDDSYLISACGYVTEISASHCDDETGEETEFSEDELHVIWDALNKNLENIA